METRYDTSKLRSNSGRVVADIIFIYEPALGNDWSLFRQYKEAGIDFIQCHPAGDDHNISDAIKRISFLRRDIKNNSDICDLVVSVADIHKAKQSGKLAVSIQLEGFRCIERELDMIDTFYALGVRLCHPIFNVTNSIGGGCADGDGYGLTGFGRRVVRRMNEVGMIVDGAHSGHRTQLDMLEFSDAPVVYTHHGIDSLHPHIRNLKDDVIRGCAAKGGVVGISGAGYYLGGSPSPELLFRHIDHVVQMVGPAHVGLGLDWAADPDAIRRLMDRNPGQWAGGREAWQPVEFSHPSIVGPTLDLMENAGYRPESIDAILGGNWLRVASAVWK